MSTVSRIVARSARALALAPGPALAPEQFVNALTGRTGGVYIKTLADLKGKKMG